MVDLEQPGAPLDVPGVEVVGSTGRASGCGSAATGHTASSLLAEVTARAPVRDVTVEEPAIEDVGRRIYLDGTSPAPAQ